MPSEAGQKPSQRSQRIRAARFRLSEQRRFEILAIIETNQPCHLTSEQIGKMVGISGRQVTTHLKILREAGLITCKVTFVRDSGHVVAVRTILVVDSEPNGNRVPEGQVGLEADASPRGEAPGDHPQDPEDM